MAIDDGFQVGGEVAVQSRRGAMRFRQRDGF